VRKQDTALACTPEGAYLEANRMRFDMFRKGDARGADRLGEGDVFLRLGVVECIDLRLLLDRTTVGDFRPGALLWQDGGSVC
jgi:hypothetical protein